MQPFPCSHKAYCWHTFSPAISASSYKLLTAPISRMMNKIRPAIAHKKLRACFTTASITIATRKIVATSFHILNCCELYLKIPGNFQIQFATIENMERSSHYFLLVAIVMLAVVKQALSFLWAMAGLILFIILLMGAVNL